MNQTNVGAYVKTALAAMTGIVSVQQGMGDSNFTLPSEYPYIEYTVGEARNDMTTFSVGGTVLSTYDILFRLYLGTAEMLARDAEAAKLVYADRIRAKFAPDWTLGGNCTDLDWGAVSSNLDIFRDNGERPYTEYVLTVTEQTTANAAVSGG